MVSLKYCRSGDVDAARVAVAQAGHQLAVAIEDVDVEEGVAQAFVRFQQGLHPLQRHLVHGHFLGQ
jgi:hypothetical protein